MSNRTDDYVRFDIIDVHIHSFAELSECEKYECIHIIKNIYVCIHQTIEDSLERVVKLLIIYKTSDR